MPPVLAAPGVTAPPAPTTADVLVLVAHPRLETSRANRMMMEAAAAPYLDAGVAPPLVVVRDLYRLYPDYLIDVAAEQAALEAARLVVWQHPIQWYHMPSLMKLWVDDVLSFGWAYGHEGMALQGKDLWLVATTGGPEDSYRPDRYNRYFFDAFLPPYEQTAALCGMRFLPPLLLHGSHRVADDELRRHAAVYRERLFSYPDWPEIDGLPPCVGCEVPPNARPVSGAAPS